MKFTLEEKLYLHDTVLQKVRRLMRQNGGQETRMVLVLRTVAMRIATKE